MQFVNPMPWQDAVDLIGDKTPIGAKLSSSEWADVPVALRQRAMFSANVENVRFLQRAQDALGDFLSGNKVTLPDGQVMLATGGRAAFIQQLREFAQAEGMGSLEGEKGEVRGKNGLQDITSERRLGLIFDVQTRQAGDYSYWRQGMDPDVLNMFPAQRFIRVLAVKEPRTSHALYVNQVYLKTDPIWARVINEDFHVPWGPWAWGCGHDVEDVDRQESEKLGLLAPGQRLEPDRRNFNENLQASARGLAPELLQKLHGVFGHRIQMANDTLRWVEPPVRPQPEPKTRLEKALIPIEQDLANRRGTEKVVVLDPAGKMIYQKEGTVDTAVVPKEVDIEDAVVTHNHPGGTGFSVQDLNFALSRNISQIRVVGVRAPFTYILDRPAAGWPDNLAARYTALFRRADAADTLRVMAGEVTEEQALLDTYDQALRELAAEIHTTYERR